MAEEDKAVVLVEDGLDDVAFFVHAFGKPDWLRA